RREIECILPSGAIEADLQEVRRREVGRDERPVVGRRGNDLGDERMFFSGGAATAIVALVRAAGSAAAGASGGAATVDRLDLEWLRATGGAAGSRLLNAFSLGPLRRGEHPAGAGREGGLHNADRGNRQQGGDLRRQAVAG